jgi:hypothetical protein
MRTFHYRVLFASCASGWLILSLLIAPSFSGADAFIFRDPGWNLAAWGSFESAAGPYSHDLIPRFYAYYTPVVPLLFAGYASVLPRNVYAGTIFNLLLGLSVAAVALRWVLRQLAGKLRSTVAWTVAVLAPAFIIYDRPEVVALILFSAALALAAKPGPRPVVAGMLIALTFLADPFAAIVVALWTSVLYFSHEWDRSQRWLRIFTQFATMTITVVILLSPVALLYYSIDHTSLARFAANALGPDSGVGVTLSIKSVRDFVDVMRATIFGIPVTVPAIYLLSFLSCCSLAVWSFFNRKVLGHVEWLAIAAGLTCMFLAVILVPYQVAYVEFVAFSIPMGLLILSRPGALLAKPALVMLLLAMLMELPSLGIGLIARIEQKPSFLAAREQPAFLRARIASPDPVVVLIGDFYDLFKPEFHRMVQLDYLENDVNHFADVAAVVNCYHPYHGESGTVAPFPSALKASEFHLIQSAPQHLWVTLFGHKVMRGQWGYGCDLYVRNSAPPSISSP